MKLSSCETSLFDMSTTIKLLQNKVKANRIRFFKSFFID